MSRENRPISLMHRHPTQTRRVKQAPVGNGALSRLAQPRMVTGVGMKRDGMAIAASPSEDKRMPKFVTIGYGDQAGYERIAPARRA